MEGGSRGAPREVSAQGWCSGDLRKCPWEPSWLQARRGSRRAGPGRGRQLLTSTSTCQLRLAAQRSPQPLRNFCRSLSCLFPQQEELDEVAAARAEARVDEELPAAAWLDSQGTRGRWRRLLQATSEAGNTSHCPGEFIKPKWLNVNSSELNIGRVARSTHLLIERSPCPSRHEDPEDSL